MKRPAAATPATSRGWPRADTTAATAATTATTTAATAATTATTATTATSVMDAPSDAALVETPPEDAAAPTLYAAPIIAPPTPEELRLAEARKQMLRALDTKITQEDDATALAAIELLERLVSNILTHPDEPKYREFKASNPAISKKLLKVPGGMEFVNAAGFSTKVVQFEEIWQLHGSGIELTVLEHAQEGLARYKALVHERLQRRSMLTPSGHGPLSTPHRLGRLVPLRASRQDAGQGRPLVAAKGWWSCRPRCGLFDHPGNARRRAKSESAA